MKNRKKKKKKEKEEKKRENETFEILSNTGAPPDISP